MIQGMSRHCCLVIAWALALLALTGCSGTAETDPVELTSAQAEAFFVGEETCLECHTQDNGHWSHTVHAGIFRAAEPESLASRTCEACHGPGSEHIVFPGDKSLILGFTHASNYSINQQNSVCLQCHNNGEQLHWQGSPHQVSQVGCSDCHNTMANISKTGMLSQQGINETCYTCHQEQRADFRKRSHMPLPEGKMDCTDCHNPHGSTTKSLLADLSVNQLCFQCHQEKRGPFIWEHAPARQDCMNCHEAHGSNHDALLTSARPFLCQQCHSNPGHPNDLLTSTNLPVGNLPDARIMNRSCQNCHVQIHGSNHPSGALFQR